MEEAPCRPEPVSRKGDQLIGVRVGLHEISLQRQVKQAGATWNPSVRLWELRRDLALKLGLKDRIESIEVSISRSRFVQIETCFYLHKPSQQSNSS